MDTAAPDQGTDTLDDSPISDAELDALAKPEPEAEGLPDAKLDELVAEPKTPPEAFADDPIWNTLADRFESSDDLLDAASGGDPHVAAMLERSLGRGQDLRLGVAYAARAYQALLTPELAARLDAAGVLDSPELLVLGARLGRQLVRGTSVMREGGSMNETQATGPKPTREQADKLQQAIDQVYERHRGKPSMTSPETQRQLRKLFKAKIQGASPLP